MSFSPCSSNVLAVETGSVVIRSQAIKLYTNHFLLSRKLLPVRWGIIFILTFGHMWKLGQWLVVILLLLEFSKSLSWIMSLCFFSPLLMFQNFQETPHKISVTGQFCICLCADIIYPFNLKISSPSSSASFTCDHDLLSLTRFLLHPLYSPSFMHLQCPHFQSILPFCFNYQPHLYSSPKFLPCLYYPPWVSNFVADLSERIVWS